MTAVMADAPSDVRAATSPLASAPVRHSGTIVYRRRARGRGTHSRAAIAARDPGGAVPVDQGICCEPVAEILQAWSVTVVRATQADPSRDGIECAMNLPVIQLITPTGDEQVRRH